MEVQRKIIFPEFCISLRTISIYITARINMLRQCDLLCVILERGEMWENPLRKYFILRSKKTSEEKMRATKRERESAKENECKMRVVSILV